MRGAVAKRLERLTPCLCRTLNSPLSRITIGVRSKPLSNYFALYFIIPPPRCFLLSLLSFFFVSYNFFVRFHNARKSCNWGAELGARKNASDEQKPEVEVSCLITSASFSFPTTLSLSFEKSLTAWFT